MGNDGGKCGKTGTEWRKGMKWLKSINIEIDWFLVFLVIAVIIYVPFACVYYSIKWLYCQLPWVSKRIKEKKLLAAKLEELKKTKIRKMDAKIKELEEKLGLQERLFPIHYDPFYYKNPKPEEPDIYRDVIENTGPTTLERIAYYKDLRQKVKSGFRSADIIVAVNVNNADFIYKTKECNVLLFVRNECYACPDEAKPAKRVLHGEYEDEIRTLAECGPYQDYFLVKVPGRFNYLAVVENKEERLSKYIDDFKQKYKKPVQKDIAI